MGGLASKRIESWMQVNMEERTRGLVAAHSSMCKIIFYTVVIIAMVF